MRGRALLFILVNILVTVGVVLVVIAALNNRNQPTETAPVVITVPILVTATQNPNATPNVIIITATLQPGQVALPTEIIGEIQGSSANSTRIAAALPTVDSTLAAQTGQGEVLAAAETSLPEGCIPHVVQSGDSPFGIAEQYGADGFALMEINGLDDVAAANLQIGQVLIVPLEGCSLTAETVSATQTATGLPSPSATNTPSPSPTSNVTPSSTPSATSTRTLTSTPTATFTPSNTPTSTLPPTAENAKVQIVRVIDAGSVTGEGVEIRNNDTAVIDLSGWRLQDAQGNTYTFPDQRRLFGGGAITLFSRVGDDTPVVVFWDQETAMFTSGEIIALINREGNAQSTFTVP
jgi:LysM repeat protein